MHRKNNNSNHRLLPGALFLLGLFSLSSCEADEKEMDDTLKSKTISFSAKASSRATTKASDGYLVLRGENPADTLCLTPVVTDGIVLSSDTTDRTTTKAAPVGSANFYDRLKIWGIRTSTADNTQDLYIDDILTGTIDDAVWDYESNNTYFWPGAEYTLRFFSYAPLDATGLTPPTLPGETTFDYTVPNEVSEQKDIVVATIGETAGDAATGPLSLQFSHIASAIRFEMGDDLIETGTIQSVTLKGIAGMGTYDINAATWTLGNDPSRDFTQTLDKSFDGTEKPGDAITASEQTFLMIPQTLGTDATVEIVFQNATGTTRTLSASLSGQEWPMGQTVTYRLSIQPDVPDIGLDLEVLLDQSMTVDAHFLSFRVNVKTSDGSDNTGAWTLTSDLPEDVFFQDTTNLTAFQRENYWVDEDKGNNTITESTPKGLQVYVTENATTEPRYLQLKLSNAKGETIVKNVKQLPPLWNLNGDIGCEQIEEIGVNTKMTFPWGFNPENYTETYEGTKEAPGILDKFREWLQKVFGTVFAKIDYVEIPLKKDPITIIRYADAVSQIGTDRDNGLENTKKLLNYNGTDFDALKNILRVWVEAGLIQKIDSGNPNTIDVDNFAAKVAVKKNRCHKNSTTNSFSVQGNTYTYTIEQLTIDDEDFNWYLPALNECTSAYENAKLESNYWSSTAVEGEISVGNAKAYSIFGNEVDRGEAGKVCAVRRRPTTP